jgi:rhodanese-related sulfurtransferase
MFPEHVPGVTPAEVTAMTEDGWMLLDVRTDDEWAEGRIEGSTHIPMDQLMERLDEVPHQVVVTCAVGGRSSRVTQFLNTHGHEAVNLEGGLQGWLAEGRPVVS